MARIPEACEDPLDRASESSGYDLSLTSRGSLEKNADRDVHVLVTQKVRQWQSEPS